MRLFRRRQNDLPDPRTPLPELPVPADAEAAAATFWNRWYEALPEINGALGDREPGRVEELIGEMVAEVHPDLQFSIEGGQVAIYALVVSGQEDPALRPYTDAWKAAAPPDDAIWEYHDSIPAVPNPEDVTINLGAHRIELSDVRVVAQVDEHEAVVDVAVHHPVFAELEAAAAQALTFLPLDATLGERLAATRLRRVETAELEPANAITLVELRELVTGLDERERGGSGDDSPGAPNTAPSEGDTGQGPGDDVGPGH